MISAMHVVIYVLYTEIIYVLCVALSLLKTNMLTLFSDSIVVVGLLVLRMTVAWRGYS